MPDLLYTSMGNVMAEQQLISITFKIERNKSTFAMAVKITSASKDQRLNALGKNMQNMYINSK